MSIYKEDKTYVTQSQCAYKPVSSGCSQVAYLTPAWDHIPSYDTLVKEGGCSTYPSITYAYGKCSNKCCPPYKVVQSAPMGCKPCALAAPTPCTVNAQTQCKPKKCQSVSACDTYGGQAARLPVLSVDVDVGSSVTTLPGHAVQLPSSGVVTLPAQVETFQPSAGGFPAATMPGKLF
jgi:hypothetical protein